MRLAMIALNDLARQTRIIRDHVDAAVARVCDRGWYVNGPELAAFESEFADYCGGGHGVGCANGTDALELGLLALGIQRGDEVVIAANAGFYSATALRAVGAQPVYVDVDGSSLVLNAPAIAAAVSAATKAVIVTHLYGRMAPMRSVRTLCDERGIALIEDCAQAHGARQEGRRAGHWGDIGCFSFYPTKNLGAIGDGGLVLCRRADVADRLRQLRQYGWQQKYVSVSGPARNSRLDELQAAVLRTKLPLLDAWNERRREIARAYAGVANADIAHPDVRGDDYVAHLYVVRTPFRDSLQRHLQGAGIASEVHYPLLDTQQPVLAAPDSWHLPESEKAVKEILTLPCYPELADREVRHICDTLATWKR